MTKHDGSYAPFSEHLSTYFSENLIEDMKLVIDSVLQVSRRYLPLFQLSRKSGGGKTYHSAGRVLKQSVWGRLKKQEKVSTQKQCTINSAL